MAFSLFDKVSSTFSYPTRLSLSLSLSKLSLSGPTTAAFRVPYAGCACVCVCGPRHETSKDDRSANYYAKSRESESVSPRGGICPIDLIIERVKNERDKSQVHPRPPKFQSPPGGQLQPVASPHLTGAFSFSSSWPPERLARNLFRRSFHHRLDLLLSLFGRGD